MKPLHMNYSQILRIYIVRSLLILTIFYSKLQTTVLVKGNSRQPKQLTFDKTILAHTYDPFTGTLFVGLDENAKSYAISYVGRYHGQTDPKCTGIAHDDLIKDKGIELLAVIPIHDGQQRARQKNSSKKTCTSLPALAAVARDPNEPDNTFTQKTVTYVSGDGRTVVESSELNDASEDEKVTSGIVALTAGNYILNSVVTPVIFAAVRPSSRSNNQFGQPNSGIATVLIDPKTCELTQTPTTEMPISTLLDPTTAALAIQNNVTITTTNQSPAPSLYWDNYLQRLYCGLDVTTGAVANDGARSVAVGMLTDTAQLEFLAIAPDQAFDATNTQNIVGVITDTTTKRRVQAHTVRTMHTSTGLSYLIVNGGVLLDAAVTSSSDYYCNFVQALPLVDNPNDPEIHGTLANKNQELEIGEPFTEAATANDDLVTDDEVAVRVGRTALPIPGDVAHCPSDMYVSGDTVYVAINTQRISTTDEGNETGVFASQALFDGTGKIARWTDWKRVLPLSAFDVRKTVTCMDSYSTLNPSLISTQDSQNCRLIEKNSDEATRGITQSVVVDAVNGKLWAIGGKNSQKIVSTQWTQDSSNTGSLTQTISQLLPHGCYSVLDLNRTTLGLGSLNQNRYALFGGITKDDKPTVVFTKTAYSCPLNSITEPTDVDPETDIPFVQDIKESYINTNGTLNENLIKISMLPKNAGCPTSLEFSRGQRIDDNEDPISDNYFFAGTPTGLFIFADTGATGFDLAALNDLNQEPYSTGRWFKASVPELATAIIALKACGNKLFILTRSTDPKTPLLTHVYSLNFAPTIKEMLDSLTLIAQSDNFPSDDPNNKVRSFSDLEYIQVDDPSSMPEIIIQLLLSTNSGIYQTNRAGGVQQDDTDQDNAGWACLPDSDFTMYRGLASMDTPDPSTVWPISIEDEKNYKTYNKSSLYQISNTTDEELCTFDPSPFNAYVNPTERASTLQFATLDPIINFYSDGNRRFFTIQRIYKNCRTSQHLMVMPYNIKQWGITDPTNQLLIDQVLNTISTYNWVQYIGDTGILMAGTDQGVISLT